MKATPPTLILAAAAVAAMTIAIGVSGAARGKTTPGRAKAVDPAAMAATQANSEFGLDLYAQLAKANAGKNLFFSPYSMSVALAMTAEGARGETALEMGKVLGYPNMARGAGKALPWKMPAIHEGFSTLSARLTARKTPAGAAARTKSNSYELRIANALYGEKTYPFLDSYEQTIGKYYETGAIRQADFKNNYPTERAKINQWVEEQTANRIKNLLPNLSPNQAKLLRLVLVNAIYFKGDWSVPFKETSTKDRPFLLPGGKTVRTPIMNASKLDAAKYGAFNGDGSTFDTPWRIKPGQKEGLYPGKDGFAMVELPYKGYDLSMVVIAPNDPDGLGTIEKQLSAKDLSAWIAKLRYRKTHILLPKFKLETDYPMGETLQAMGMVRAFTDPAMPNGADFSGMSASKDPMDQLYIGKVIHKAFVEVNEKGTEAAAATGVMMPARGAAMPLNEFTPTFKADRPFVFLIRDVKTGVILFLGRVTNPKG